MHIQAAYALAHPVFDPMTQITGGNFWRVQGTAMSACLTVNLGME